LSYETVCCFFWDPKRCGSCAAKGSITLNVDLVRAAPRLIDYVIGHELARGFHGNHDEERRILIEGVMPDWERRKPRLEIAASPADGYAPRRMLKALATACGGSDLRPVVPLSAVRCRNWLLASWMARAPSSRRRCRVEFPGFIRGPATI
jgi:hypothetical protein